MTTYRAPDWDDGQDRYDPGDDIDWDRMELVECSACCGSGEGMHDGSRCPVCHGSGEVLAEIDEPVEEED